METNISQIEEYKQRYESNRQKIIALQSRIADLDTEFETESERCNKAINANTAGIRYARRIQSAAFPQREIGNVFDDYFIYTKPHSIVTGDFYKAVAIKHHKIFALADCAGHGVPGAYLTMLGLSALKESIARRFYDEDINLADILDEMRSFVKSSLRSDNEISNAVGINDGINLSLCVFSNGGDTVRFAGANQSAYLYSDGQLATFQGDRMPIGWSFKGDGQFSEILIPAKKGDMLYLVTNSLQNQFGGPNNAKFSSKRLLATLEQIAPLPTAEQKQTVSDIVENWVKGYEHIDDLTLTGVRV